MVKARTTKVFKSGNSQAIRLPKDFQLDCHEVEIFRRHGDIVVREIPKNLSTAFALLASFSADFFAEGKADTSPQERDEFE